MGRRSDHTREDLKEKALTAAEILVRKKGLSALTARNVAAEIGYAVGTLYNLFSNIDDLILHINARTLSDMHKHMQKARSIKTLARIYIEYANTHPNLWRMLFEHQLKQRKALPNWYQEKIDVIFALTETLLAKEISAQKRTLKKSAKVLWASIHGICTLSLNGTLETTQSESAQTLANNVIDHYLRGLKVT